MSGCSSTTNDWVSDQSGRGTLCVSMDACGSCIPSTQPVHEHACIQQLHALHPAGPARSAPEAALRAPQHPEPQRSCLTCRLANLPPPCPALYHTCLLSCTSFPCQVFLEENEDEADRVAIKEDKAREIEKSNIKARS